MPKPVYIICAQSGSQDSETKLVSLFDICERLEVQETVQRTATAEGESPKQQIVMDTISLYIVATWMKLPDDDAEIEYEHQFVLHFPGPESREVTVGAATGVYFNNDRLPTNRYLLRARMRPFSHAGILRIESRIRPVGSEEWFSQEYPVLIAHSQAEEQLDAQHVNAGITNQQG